MGLGVVGLTHPFIIHTLLSIFSPNVLAAIDDPYPDPLIH